MRFSKTVPLTVAVTSGDVHSQAITLQQDYGFAAQAVWTGGTLVGSLKLQVTINGTTWSDVVGSAEAVSGPGSFVWNVQGAFYDQARLYFTRTSGTGSIVFNFETKGP